VTLSGAMEVCFGALRIHKLMKFVTLPVKLGFLNALAIVIFEAQKHSFYEPADHKEGEIAHSQKFISGIPLYLMLSLAIIALIINLIPFEKLQKLPLALISIVICTGLEWGLIRIKYETPLVQDLADLSSGFPTPIFLSKSSNVPVLPALNLWETWKVILPLAFFLAMIGIVESLMTLEAIDAAIKSKTDGKAIYMMKRDFSYRIKKVLLNDPRDLASAQQEMFAQGVGNILSGLFATMGGCAMIGQSMINVENGGDRKLSSVVAGVFTLLIIVVLSPAIGIIPLGSLVGVMVCVSYHTFEFSSVGWMLNSLIGGGRTFFGILKSDGCLSKFFYGKEEESATESEKIMKPELSHSEEFKDGETAPCKIDIDKEAFAWASEIVSEEETKVQDSESRPLTSGSGGSGSDSLKLDKIQSCRGSKALSPTSPKVSNETDITSKEEKLSNLNIMDTMVIVLTIVLTVKMNLAVAVLAGGFTSNVERYVRHKFLPRFVKASAKISSRSDSEESIPVIPVQEKDCVEEKSQTKGVV